MFPNHFSSIAHFHCKSSLPLLILSLALPTCSWSVCLLKCHSEKAGVNISNQGVSAAWYYGSYCCPSSQVAPQCDLYHSSYHLAQMSLYSSRLDCCSRPFLQPIKKSAQGASEVVCHGLPFSSTVLRRVNECIFYHWKSRQVIKVHSRSDYLQYTRDLAQKSVSHMIPTKRS